MRPTEPGGLAVSDSFFPAAIPSHPLKPKPPNPHPPSPEKEEELRRHQQSLAYQRELESQLQDEEEKKKEAYDEFLREKQLVDQIVAKIYEEDRKEAEREMYKKKKTREEFDAFQSQRDAWRRKEEETIARENAAIRA